MSKNKLHNSKAACAECAKTLQQQGQSQPSLLKGPGRDILMPSAGIACSCLPWPEGEIGEVLKEPSRLCIVQQQRTPRQHCLWYSESQGQSARTTELAKGARQFVVQKAWTFQV